MKSNLTLLFGLLLFSTLHAQVPAYVPTDGLVGWWPFNGNANDESGNGNDGVVNGATLTEDRFGNAASAYSFDGVDDFIEYSESINNLNFPITIAAFLQIPIQDVNGSVYDFMVFSSDESPSSYSGIWFAASENTIELSFGGNGPRNSLITPTGIPRGTWVQVVGVINGPNDMAIYLDGNNVDGAYSGTAVSMIDLGNTSTSAYYNTNNGLETYQSGLLDDIAIYNRALTEQEIQNLYAGTTPAACPTLSANLQTGLVGYWPFCGNANDESGNGNDGVVNGATLTEDRFGNANAAYGFDGVNNSIITPALLNASNDLTFSCWVNSNSESNQTILNTIPHTVIGYGLNPWWAGSGNISFLYGNGQSAGWSGDNSVIVNPIPFLNTWVNHVIIKSGLHWKFLENNSVIYEFDSSNQPADIVAQLVFGHCDPSICAETLSGSLDDIAIWNRALTPEEVQELYTGQPVTPPVTCTPLPSNLQTGLVGYWPFCGNANDESGNGNDGVVNGATLTEDRFGNAGSAYSFDGVDYISGSAVNFPAGNSSRSISLWFQSDSILNEDPSILGTQLFGYGGGSCGTSFIGYFGAPYTFDVQGHCGNSVFSESIPSNINGPWHNLVLNYQSDNLEFYLDGVLMGTQPVSFNTSVNALSKFFWGIEVYPNGTEPYLNDISIWPSFQGTLDDIAIWNRALTPEEVQELYTLDACTFTVYDTLTVENIINVYDTLTIENIVDIYDTTYINVEVYDTLTVENIINVYDTLTIENVIDVFDTTTVVETVVVFDTLTVENVINVFDTTTVVETVVVFDTLTVENVIDVFDTTTVVETVVVFDTLTVENVIDVYDTTYVTVTDTLIIDIPSGVGGTILNTLLLYPNPTSDQLTISYGNFAVMAGYSLSIFDNGGSAVHENESISQAQETLDITQWSAGVYQVVVYNAGGVPVETRQIVIQ
ncbi:MAG: LamG-like jellyroll fold domain-containing protein [Flavobacteriales bacterium]|jgi:hypothetical protein